MWLRSTTYMQDVHFFGMLESVSGLLSLFHKSTMFCIYCECKQKPFTFSSDVLLLSWRSILICVRLYNETKSFVIVPMCVVEVRWWNMSLEERWILPHLSVISQKSSTTSLKTAVASILINLSITVTNQKLIKHLILYSTEEKDPLFLTPFLLVHLGEDKRLSRVRVWTVR